MKRFNNCVICILFCVFSVVPAVSENKPSPCMWQLGVFEFQSNENTGTLDHLKYSIPQTLLGSIKSIPRHFLSQKEKNEIADLDYTNTVRTKKTELSSLYKKRDTLFFSGQATQNGMDDIAARIARKKDEIAHLKLTDFTDCKQDYLEIVLGGENNKGTLFSLTGNSLETIAAARNLKQALYGKLEMVDQWLYLSVYLYNYLSHDKETLYQRLIDPAAVHDVLPEILSVVSNRIRGREPPVLMVKGDPPASLFNLDNGKNYSTNAPVSVFLPGKHLLTIHCAGYDSEQQEINLNENEKLVVPYTLKQKETGFVSVSTFPEGADIYSGSFWLGKSPLVLTDPVFPLYLSFTKESYNAMNSIIDSTAVSKSLRFFLTPDTIDTGRIIKMRRKKFYTSFAWFVISLSVPVVSYGMSSDYGYAYNNLAQTNPFGDEAQRLMTSSTVWYNLYLGGMFVSASLFINMALDLWNYIKLYN